MMKAQLMIRNNEEISQLYTPTERHTSEEANICLNCNEYDCKGDCMRFRRERRKILKELKNDK